MWQVLRRILCSETLRLEGEAGVEVLGEFSKKLTSCLFVLRDIVIREERENMVSGGTMKEEDEKADDSCDPSYRPLIQRVDGRGSWRGSKCEGIFVSI